MLWNDFTDGELLKLVPPDERPFIPYTNRLKVPRFCRQTEVHTLTGKYLAFLLKRMDLATEERCLKVRLLNMNIAYSIVIRRFDRIAS